jgi:hypothetical protein
MRAATARRSFDRALGYLLQLYIDAQHYDGAAALLATICRRRAVGIDLPAGGACSERCAEAEPARDAIRGALAVETPTATTRQESCCAAASPRRLRRSGNLYEGLADDAAVGPSALEALARSVSGAATPTARCAPNACAPAMPVRWRAASTPR